MSAFHISFTRFDFFLQKTVYLSLQLMGAMRYILGHLFHYMYVQAYTRYQYFNIIMTRTINQKYIASNYRFFFICCLFLLRVGERASIVFKSFINYITRTRKHKWFP